MQYLDYFKEISKIPRCSGSEEDISAYLMRFAYEKKLDTTQDNEFNVIIKKPASPGYEKADPIMLQAHMDMVCEKISNSKHDFSKDPIAVYQDENFLRAGETSLGADDGIGMAYILAILADKDIPHPPLEAVFTASEEVGLHGMAMLDISPLKSERMINLDGEKEGVLLTGCAGGRRLRMELAIASYPVEEDRYAYSISVRGLRGGHSGTDIDKGRANAIQLLARVLQELNRSFSIQVSEITGGSKENAIPREATAQILIKHEETKIISDKIGRINTTFVQEYASGDPDISVHMERIEETPKRILRSESLENLLAAILLTPSGVLCRNPDLEGMVDTSCNLGIVKTGESHILLSTLIRSNTNSRIREATAKISLLGTMLNARVSIGNDYSAWEFNQDSALLALCSNVYQTAFGSEPQIATIHGGLECALMAKKRPGIDMISFGPNLFGVHTTEEKAEIASIHRTWIFLLNILKAAK